MIERTKCLLNTTGIEPLGGELAEILSRSFIIRFDMDGEASDCFLEAKILASIRENRDLIVSAMMKRTGQVLAMLRDGGQEKVMRLLHKTLGNHGKRRCNDYLSLMYLMMLAGEPPEVIDHALDEIHPEFLERIASLNSVSMETARDKSCGNRNSKKSQLMQAKTAPKSTISLWGISRPRVTFSNQNGWTFGTMASAGL